MKRTAMLVVAVVAAFLVAVGGIAAQPAGKIPSVGVLRPGDPPPEDFGQRDAFEAGLRELGWIPGTTIQIEYRYSEGKHERLATLATELARLPVDVLVASAPQGVRAAQQATRTIPIVMATLPDPVAEGFVASLARPGGNTTGVTLDSEELAGKQLELLKEALPTVTRVGVLRNPASPGWEPGRKQLEAAARRLKIELKDFPVRRSEDLAATFAAMSQAAVDAIIVRRDVLIIEPNQAEVIALAAQRRLPAMYNFREFPQAGGFMSYGANVKELHRRSALFVDRILKGAKPADLPIEQPRKFDLVINLRTAKALGLALPSSMLLRADHVIE